MDIEIIININKYHSFFKGLINYMVKEEDPSTRKILEGGTAFRWVYMQKFRSVWYQVEKDLELREGIQNNGRQKQAIWTLLPSLLALITTFQQS